MNKDNINAKNIVFSMFFKDQVNFDCTLKLYVYIFISFKEFNRRKQ